MRIMRGLGRVAAKLALVGGLLVISPLLIVGALLGAVGFSMGYLFSIMYDWIEAKVYGY